MIRTTNGRVASVLGIPKHKLATIEKQRPDFGVTRKPLGNSKDSLLLLSEQAGVSRGVQPRWLIWAFFSMSVSGA